MKTHSRSARPSLSYFSWILLLLSALTIAGCATPSSQPPAEVPWLVRQEALTAVQDWNVVGRIGVTNAQDGWHASLQWTQRGPDYAIDLFGPWGQGRVRIEGNAQQVSMRTADGQVRQAADPEQLLAEALGVRIPLNGLRYWVRGLPDPGSSSQLQGDNQGRLSQLEQNGWVIRYPRYQPVAALELPKQIRAKQQDWQVRIAIREWNLQPPPLQSSL